MRQDYSSQCAGKHTLEPSLPWSAYSGGRADIDFDEGSVWEFIAARNFDWSVDCGEDGEERGGVGRGAISAVKRVERGGLGHCWGSFICSWCVMLKPIGMELL